MLTIAYTTGRMEPKIEWFFESLHRETRGDCSDLDIIAVDSYFGTPGRHPNCTLQEFRHVEPKPTVWQGPGRLTKENWFAKCNALNTALCLAKGPWIAFVDDLSVLMPGWLSAAREAIAGGYVACGAYRKVKNMVVEKGQLVSFDDHPSGNDHRLAAAPTKRPCGSSWMYGCSTVAPLEAWLEINGAPEALCDGMGYEDTTIGRMMMNNGRQLVFDPALMTYESEELHFVGPRMRREDPCKGDPNAKPRDDKSHALVRISQTLKAHPNYFSEGGIRGLRERVQAGEPFPQAGIPEHEWFTGQRLADL